MRSPFSGVTFSVLAMLVCLIGPSSLPGHASVPLVDGPDGVTCQYFYAAVQAEWSIRGGDWRDANGVLHGPKPFVSIPVPRKNTRQVIESDVTDAVRAGLVASSQIALMLRPVSGAPEGVANFSSRENGEPNAHPGLTIIRSDGVATMLSPIADTSINCTTIRSLGDLETISVGGNDAAVVVFDAEPIAGYAIQRATLSLTTDRQWGNGTAAGVFLLWPPSLEPTQSEMGLAANYPADEGIERHPSVLFVENFESADWARLWPTVGNANIVATVNLGEENGFTPLAGNALRVSLHPRSNLGLDARYDFAKALGFEPEQVYLRYYLRFGEDWAPTRDGGKLPGLAGTYNRGGWGRRKSDGYNGWSARGAFLKLSTEYSSMQGFAGVGSYVYHVDIEGSPSAQWGWGAGPTGRLAKNRWYSVEQYVQVNDPGKANGVLRGWIDGYLAFERTDLRFRDTPDIRIENAWFNVYHGGTALPPREMSLYIDNVVIATEYIGPAGGLP